MEEKEKEKERLFNELYQLDEEDSGEEDQSNIGVILRQSRLIPSQSDVLARTPRNGVIHSTRPEQSLLRTVSAPLASSHRQANVVASSFSSTSSSKASKQVIIDTPIMAKKNVSVTTQKGGSKTTGKRKRGQPLELKPDPQRIFNGLAFCQSSTGDRVQPSLTFIQTLYRITIYRVLGNFESRKRWSGYVDLGADLGHTSLLLPSFWRVSPLLLYQTLGCKTKYSTKRLLLSPILFQYSMFEPLTKPY